MKAFVLTAFFLLSFNCVFGQIAAIKKNIAEMYFDIPLNATKFEVRVATNSSDNFYDQENWNDYFHTVMASFYHNYKLSYLSQDCRIIFYFPTENDRTISRKINITYTENELNKCIKQYNEIVSIFDKISYTSTDGVITNSRNNQSGISKSFYSSEKAVLTQQEKIREWEFSGQPENANSDESYLHVSYHIIEATPAGHYSKNQTYIPASYWLEIILYDNKIY